MSGWLKLAWKYICFHKFKTVIMVACIFLTVFLPIAVRILLVEFNQRIVARSRSTPLVMGAKASGLDLTLQALYFRNRINDTIPFEKVAEVESTGWVKAIPIHSRFTAQTYPVVGTNLSYFDFRGLQIEEGNLLTVLGDCVLGNAVAQRLSLSVGDQLLTDQTNALNFAGDYPLKMNVRGILKRSNTPDDGAVFVDLKTAWVIQGLGHGHQNVEDEENEDFAVRRGDRIEARATVRPYLEITDANIDSFHFHGDEKDFPISALIAIANDEKSETMFMGRYIGAGEQQIAETGVQLVEPLEVIEQLMQMVFRVKSFFDANALLVAISTILLLSLVIMLSMRLRSREMQTMFKIGCSRNTITLLQVGEMLFVFLIAGLMVAAALFWVQSIAGDLVQGMIVG